MAPQYAAGSRDRHLVVVDINHVAVQNPPLLHLESHAAKVVHHLQVVSRGPHPIVDLALQSLDLRRPSLTRGLPAGGLDLEADPALEPIQDLIVETHQVVGAGVEVEVEAVIAAAEVREEMEFLPELPDLHQFLGAMAPLVSWIDVALQVKLQAKSEHNPVQHHPAVQAAEKQMLKYLVAESYFDSFIEVVQRIKLIIFLTHLEVLAKFYLFMLHGCTFQYTSFKASSVLHVERRQSTFQ